MKFVALLLLMFLATSAVGTETHECKVTNGWQIRPFSGGVLNMRIPCKYWLVNSKCGRFRVTISPANMFVYPSYAIGTLWISVWNTEDEETSPWSVRTSPKLVAKYMTGRSSSAFANKSDDSVPLTEMLTETKTNKSVTLNETGGAFRITYSPFNVNDHRNQDSELHFECFDEMESVDYPKQFCGGADSSVVNQRAKDKFGSIHNKDMLLVLDVFNNSNAAEQNEKCQRAGDLMTNTCDTPEKQIKAVEMCRKILTSRNHYKCVVKYSCDPMDVFNDCLEFVCNDYPKKTGPCERLGKATDLCRANFGELTDRVREAECFIDYFTGTDMPHISEVQTPEE